MIPINLRHFRVFLAAAELHSPTEAAERCRVTQPAVTQSLGKLETEAGGDLFERTRRGFFLTDRGRVLEGRLRPAMQRLDAALSDVAPRLTVTATYAQLRALVAVTESQNFTLAARSLGLAQPTVHRAVTQIEQEAVRVLYERTSFGMVPTRVCRDLAQAARLAFAEFEQAEADLAEFEGRDAGRIAVGALPLSRSVLLPEALARFRGVRPLQQVTVFDGPYDEMLAGLRRGDIDFIVGALRQPLPIEDVTQEWLFDDRLAIVARPGHPVAATAGPLPPAVLAGHGWAVPRKGTPARASFEAFFAGQGVRLPDSILECGSVLLMRELLGRSDLLGCISALQAEAEISRGLLARVAVDADWSPRPIGLSFRTNWMPTKAQATLLDLIRDSARLIAPL
jgi:DNA-binding transcriptional LysR family regulator